MTPKERAAMQQALEALHAELEAGTCEEFENAAEKCYEAITALREALAGNNMSPTEQTEQHPMDYDQGFIDGFVDGVEEGSRQIIEQAEHEPVAWHHPQCDGQCIACLIEKAVQDAYGTQGRDYMLRHINAAAYVRTKDLTADEVEALFWKWKSATEYPVPLFEFRDIARAVIAADREKNK